MFHFEETKDSKLAHGHEAWDPDWIEYIYGCLFECTNSACKGTVSSSGKGRLQVYYFCGDDGSEDYDYEELFTPVYFYPFIRIIELPEDTPNDVKLELEASFASFFCDPASSANHVRIALEHLLTHLKVKRFTTRDGRRSFLSLHARIGLLPNKYDHLKDLIFAVKWLGNAGSHSADSIQVDDVLDAYELMSEILKELFANTRQKTKSLAKKINKKKGPNR